ncbi:MAG TPA: hypothetical protein VGR45_17745 [Stellaceae bacterium]|nr:hypothetical protein [Stellaceae bacterium]
MFRRFYLRMTRRRAPLRLNTLFQPLEQGGRYRRAWTLLSVALTRYRADAGYKLDQVLMAYEQGEAIIHETAASQTASHQSPGQ